MSRGADPRIDPRDPVPCDGTGWLPCQGHADGCAGNPNCDAPACDGCAACTEKPECPVCNESIDDPDDAHSINGHAVHEDCCTHCAAEDARHQFARLIRTEGL